MAIPPIDALPDGETVAFVRKFKTSIVKKWSYTKADSLWSMADLACFLWALGRREAALNVACEVALQIPSPPPLKGGRFNFHIWSPASKLHSLVVHLGAHKNAVEASTKALLNEAGFARDNPDFLQQQVDVATGLASAEVGIESQKWECINFSRSINCMALFSVVAGGGDQLYKPYATDANKLIPTLLQKLGTRLMDKK